MINLPEGSTPSAPGTGVQKLYAKSDGTMARMSSTGGEKLLIDTGTAAVLAGNNAFTGVNTFQKAVITSKGATLTPAATVLTIDNLGDYYTVAAVAFATIATSGGSSATGTRVQAGVARRIILEFEGAGVITHGANIILPGAVNITTYAGLVLTFVEESAGVWRCIGGDTLFGDYGSQDFTDVSFTPSGTASLENITGAGKEFPFTPKFTGVYELEWAGTVYPTIDFHEVNLAVDASAGAPTVIRKSVFYLYDAAASVRRGQNPKTIFSLVADTAYTFNVQIRNKTATSGVNVGYSGGTSGAGKWFIKRIA